LTLIYVNNIPLQCLFQELTVIDVYKTWLKRSGIHVFLIKINSDILCDLKKNSNSWQPQKNQG
jgi:hypothetical protein